MSANPENTTSQELANWKKPDRKYETTTGSSEQTIRFLEKTHFPQTKEGDGQQFDDILQNLNEDQAIDWLKRLNGLLRQIPQAERELDGKDVVIENSAGIDLLPPDFEAKEQLLKDVFTAIKEIPDHQDQALLAYYAVQFIHPFNDGNGRTGRLIYELLNQKEGEWSSEKLENLLDHSGSGEEQKGAGREEFQKRVLAPRKVNSLVARELTKQWLGEQFVKEYGRVAAVGDVTTDYLSATLTEETNKKFKEIIEADGLGTFALNSLNLLKVIHNHPDQLSQYLRVLPTKYDVGIDPASLQEDRGKKQLVIDLEDMFGDQAVTPEMAKEVIANNTEIKNAFVGQLVEIFTHPEQHQLLENDMSVAIKDKFKLDAP